MSTEHEVPVKVDQSSDPLDQPDAIHPMEVVPCEPVKSPVKISFGVKKKAETVVIKTKSLSVAALDVAERSDEEKEEEDEEEKEEEERAAKIRKLTHFESGTISEDVEDKKKMTSIIMPMILDSRVQKLLEQETDGSITDSDRARLELLVGSNPALAELRKKQQNENQEAGAVVDTIKMEGEDVDYDQAPTGSFGLAYLRGCGEGIEKNPRVVPRQLFEGRPARLGLGAAPKKVDEINTKNAKNELEEPEEYKDKRRIDKEKEKYAKARRDERGLEKKDMEDKDHETKKDDDTEVWVRADCGVRMVSEDYKEGTYLDHKMRVVDVADRKNITLEDDDGKMHYNIHQSWLETVIPRNIGEKVLILRGPHRGAKGVMVDKDRERESIQVSIIPTHEIVKVAFDDACMWAPQVVDLDDDE